VRRLVGALPLPITGRGQASLSARENHRRPKDSRNWLGGTVIDAPDDKSARGIQKFNQQLTSHPNLETILIPVMRDNIDGLAIARVK